MRENMKSGGAVITKTFSSKSRPGVLKKTPTPSRDAGGRKGRTVFLPTPREREVLKLLWTGHFNREIADRLKISARTIEAHRASLMKQLRVGNTAQLVRVAIEQGLIKVGAKHHDVSVVKHLSLGKNR